MIRKTALILSATALCAVSAPAFAGGPSTPGTTTAGSAVSAQATVVSIIVRTSVGGGRANLGGGLAALYRAAARGSLIAGGGAGGIATAFGVIVSASSPTGFADADGNPVNADGTPAA